MKPKLRLWSCQKRPPSVRRLPGTVLACLAAGAALSGISCKKAAPAAPPPPIVVVAEVTSTNVPFSAELIGQLDSPQNVEVRARVEAFVDKMLFAEGLPVKAGDLLFELDKKPFDQRLAAANGMLAEAEAALKKYLTDVARLEPLEEQHAIPKQDLDNARASVEMGRANVVSAQARVQSAKIDLEYCEVRAPISGLIGAKQVSEGELVGKGEPTLLATISTLDPIWFYGNISEISYLRAESESRRTGRRTQDLSLSLILGDGSIHPSPGKIVFLDRAVDVKTGTLRVRAQFSNPDEVLRPGMFARVKVDWGARTNSILVPQRAVTELQGKYFAWIIGPDHKATQRAVKVGETIGSNVLIPDGLKPGDRIVIEGLQKVREGAAVQPMTAEEYALAVQQALAAPARPAQE